MTSRCIAPIMAPRKRRSTNIRTAITATHNNYDNSTNDEEFNGLISTTKKKMVLIGASIILLFIFAILAMDNSSSLFVVGRITGTTTTSTTPRSISDDGKLLKVKCQNVFIPDLISPHLFSMYRYAKICYPDTEFNSDGLGPNKITQKYPLHFFAHGDFGGGPFHFAYHGLITEIASHGFVVAMYLSCPIDAVCNNGQTSYLEILKVMSHLEHDTSAWWNDIIDFTAGYTASGHSTGGRAVLMIAALKDNPTKYLVDVDTNDSTSTMTKEQHTSIQKFVAVVADYPDPMYDSALNPDIQNYKIDQTPTMIITGSNDWIEPILSSWNDFTMIRSMHKVYVNMLGTNHISPLWSHSESPYIAYFSRCFITTTTTTTNDENYDNDACQNIYSDDKQKYPNSLRNVLSITPTGGRNTGDEKVGFLGCRSRSPSINHNNNDEGQEEEGEEKNQNNNNQNNNVPIEYSNYCNVVYYNKEEDEENDNNDRI